MENKATILTRNSFRPSLLRAGLVGLALLMCFFALASTGARAGKTAATLAAQSTPSPSPSPGATPGGEVDAPLSGPAINGVTPEGRARYELEFGRREFEVEVRDVNLPQGTVLSVFVNATQVAIFALD